jgi:hypothetical protein
MDILVVNPSDEVRFIKKDIASSPEAFIELKSNSEKMIVYKIKTTDPNKFQVRPTHGVLHAGKGTKITINTQKPTMQKIKNDRFLIVAGESDEPMEGMSFFFFCFEFLFKLKRIFINRSIQTSVDRKSKLTGSSKNSSIN